MYVHLHFAGLLCYALVLFTLVNSSPFPNRTDKTRTPVIVEGKNLSTSSTQSSLLTQRSVPCSNCLKKSDFLRELVADSNNIEGKGVSEEEIQKIRIDEIKTKILRKLRMAERPNQTMNKSMLPEPLQGELQYLFDEQAGQNNNAEDHDYGITERVIFIAENVDYPICLSNHHDPAGCFNFKFTKDVFNEELASAELWVYKLRDKRDIHNQTFIISEIPHASTHSHTNKRHNIVSIRETSVKNGWIKFDLTITLRRWLLKSRTSTYGLRISCKTCAMDVEDVPISNDPGEKPFIVINFNTKEQHRRAKRSGLCESKSTMCCKESLYVNFTDIGWGDWILAPEGYYANFCRGSCVEVGVSKISHYATVIQRLQNKAQLSAAQLSQLSTCCTATKLSPMSLLYTTVEGAIAYNLLPNMVVDSCGCT